MSTQRYRYPLNALYADYLRVAVGLALTLGPLLLLDLAPAIAWLLSALAILFVWFGARTALRQLSAVEISPEAIAVHGPFGGYLPWDELARMKLAYYAPRSWRSAPRRRDRYEAHAERDDRHKGWLQLTLQGMRGRPIRVESTLEGFDQVLGRSMATAARKELSLDPTTMANLSALGLDQETSLKRTRSDRGLAPNPGSRSSL